MPWVHSFSRKCWTLVQLHFYDHLGMGQGSCLTNLFRQFD